MTQLFKDLGLTKKTLSALEKKGFETPSPIQARVIPLLLNGEKNVIGQAATGTGKTAAFGLPLIERLKPGKNPQALILVPTRELATQVSDEINSFQSDKGLKVIPIYGGQSYTIQLSALKRGVDVIVGTPGRIIDHLDRGTLKLEDLSNLILDEADEMLNMGFIDDIEKIFKKANPDKKILLFSATMPREILQVAKKYMGDYELVSVKNEQMTTTQTNQIYFEVNERDKFEALCRIIDVEPDFYAIVFCKTKIDADGVASRLMERGYLAQGLHGDVQQKQRERILKQFKDKTTKILVATDVAARGIDVNDITHVINYSLPQDTESYVHRVGRTGRAGKTGTAITFVSPQEYRRLVSIQRVTKTDIQKGKIPTVESILEKRKEQLFKDIQAVLDGEKYLDFLPFVQEILKEKDAEHVVAALLKLNYENVFSSESYKNLSEVSIDTAGKTRLFIALGRQAGYSPRTLVDHLVAEAGVKSRDIDDVRVMEEFSFITVPYTDAEHIIRVFKGQKSGGKSLVSKAKEQGGRSGGGRVNYGDRRGSGDRRSSSRGGYGDRRSSGSRSASSEGRSSEGRRSGGGRPPKRPR